MTPPRRGHGGIHYRGHEVYYDLERDVFSVLEHEPSSGHRLQGQAASEVDRCIEDYRTSACAGKQVFTEKGRH